MIEISAGVWLPTKNRGAASLLLTKELPNTFWFHGMHTARFATSLKKKFP